MQSYQNKTTRVRASSARPASSRERSSKVQFITRNYDFNPMTHKLGDTEMIKKEKKSLVSKNTFQGFSNTKAENLIEENIQLKKKIFTLKQEQALLQRKLNLAKNQNSKHTKEMDAAFKNQTFWSGNNEYLVAGVKGQYERMKEKYEKKCEEFNKLQNKLATTDILELKRELNTVNQENIRLIDKISKAESKYKIILDNNKGQKYSQILLGELETQNSHMSEKISKQKGQIKNLRLEKEVQQNKINYLEKLIIEKDNSLFALNKRNKRLEKLCGEHNSKVDNLERINVEMLKDHTKSMSDYREQEAQRVEKERKIFQRVINEKNEKVEKLEKQVAYLTTILSYWKPLDDDHQNESGHASNIEGEEGHKAANPHDKSMRMSLESRQNSELAKVNFENQEQYPANKSKLDSRKLSVSQNSLEELKNKKLKDESKPRQQRRADVKRRQQAFKTRTVKEGQVAEIGEILHFRLIAQRVHINKAKEHFALSEADWAEMTEEERVWSQEYISMQECQKILGRTPFSLNSDQAQVLSRYLIQDAENDYVYCDSENENKRGIVKAILKRVVGEDDLNLSAEEIQSECNKEVGKYQAKISNILEQMYPAGIISKKKLLEIFVGSGFEIEEHILNYIIGKLVMESDDLSHINYKIIF